MLRLYPSYSLDAILCNFWLFPEVRMTMCLTDSGLGRNQDSTTKTQKKSTGNVCKSGKNSGKSMFKEGEIFRGKLVAVHLLL